MTECPLCGGEGFRRFTLPHTTAWQCRADGCGLQFASPQLDEEQLARAYSAHYYPSAKDRASDRADASDCAWGIYEETPPTVAKQLLSQLGGRVGSLKGLRMLDYGCGRGPVSAIAPEFGLVCTGIEPDAIARSTAADQLKMPVYASLDALHSAGASPQFDVILLWQVIEHLRRPWEDLQSLRAILSPRGRLVIGTMNTNCLRARVQRSHWTHYLNPTHSYYFDRTSLERTVVSSGFSQVTEWKPKFRYPQHGMVRRCLYHAASTLGVADGLYYLCSA